MKSQETLPSLSILYQSTDRLNYNSISKDKINRLIFNYFIQEGFEGAAQSFAKEAIVKKTDFSSPNTNAMEQQPQINGNNDGYTAAVRKFMGLPLMQTQNRVLSGIKTIDKRKEIKYLILKGNITAAIDEICANFPSVLDSNNFLFFKLLRLNLIEMIREHKLNYPTATEDKEQIFLEKVIVFVRENMVAKVMHSFELLKELEITMSLLCFDFDPQKPVSEMENLPDELKKLFDLSLRSECYRAVNKAILDLETVSQEPRQYQGLSFKDFSAETLGNLPPVAPLEDPSDQEDFLPDVATLIPQMSKQGIKEDASSVSETQEVPEVLSSQLERIASLWIATENKMMEKKLIKQKRYEDLMSDKDRL